MRNIASKVCFAMSATGGWLSTSSSAKRLRSLSEMEVLPDPESEVLPELEFPKPLPFKIKGPQQALEIHREVSPGRWKPIDAFGRKYDLILTPAEKDALADEVQGWKVREDGMAYTRRAERQEWDERVPEGKYTDEMRKASEAKKAPMSDEVNEQERQVEILKEKVGGIRGVLFTGKDVLVGVVNGVTHISLDALQKGASTVPMLARAVEWTSKAWLKVLTVRTTGHAINAGVQWALERPIAENAIAHYGNKALSHFLQSQVPEVVRRCCFEIGIKKLLEVRHAAGPEDVKKMRAVAEWGIGKIPPVVPGLKPGLNYGARRLFHSFVQKAEADGSPVAEKVLAIVGNDHDLDPDVKEKLKTKDPKYIAKLAGSDIVQAVLTTVDATNGELKRVEDSLEQETRELTRLKTAFPAQAARGSDAFQIARAQKSGDEPEVFPSAVVVAFSVVSSLALTGLF